jgi:hypothetical protein
MELESGVLDAVFSAITFVDSKAGVFASGFAAVVFVASESSVLLERFFTLNGLGVVVE